MSIRLTEPKSYIRAHCRWPVRRDMPSILAIDADTAAHGGRPAWGEKGILTHLRCRLAGASNLGMVATHGDDVIGYALYILWSDHVEIMDLAVSPRHRRAGVGRQMMVRMVDKLGTRRTRLDWLVRETCLDAQLFAKACGLRAIGVVPDAFNDGDGFAFTVAGEGGE